MLPDSLDLLSFQADPINAVQVTYDNAELVAEWCGGTLKMKGLDEISGENRVTLLVPPGGAPRVFPAHIDDWVIQEASGKFRVFKKNSFERIFHAI